MTLVHGMLLYSTVCYSIAPRIPPGQAKGSGKKEKGKGKREEGRGKMEKSVKIH